MMVFDYSFPEPRALALWTTLLLVSGHCASGAESSVPRSANKPPVTKPLGRGNPPKSPTPKFESRPKPTPAETNRLVEQLTLEEAYERTLTTDQSIRIAYMAIRRANLEPWRALTLMEPKITGSLGRGRFTEDTDRTSGLTTKTDRNGSSLTEKDRLNSSFDAKNTLESLDFNESKRERENVTKDYLHRDSRTSSAQIVLQQPLLDLTVFPAWKLGKLTAEASRLECRYVVREVLFGVAKAFYALLKSEGLLGVDQETVRLAEKQLEQAQKRFDAGESLRTDVLRARVNLEGARRQLIGASTSVRINRNTLANILNLDPASPLTLVTPPSAVNPKAPLAEALSRAYSQREDFKVSQLAIEQHRQMRNTVAAGFMPRVVAQLRGQVIDDHGAFRREERGVEKLEGEGSANGSLTETTLGGTITGPSSSSFSSDYRDHYSNHSTGSYSGSNTSWEAVVAVEVPLWGRLTLDMKDSSLQLAQSRLEEEKVSKKIQEEVNLAWLSVNDYEQTLKALRTEVEAAEQNYKDLQNQYTAGSVTSLDTLVALRDLNSARTLLISQTFDYEVAVRDLQRATADFQPQRISSLKFR